MTFNILLLVAGNFAASFAVIFIKASATHPILLSAYRLFIAAVLLTPVYVREAKKHGIPIRFSMMKPSILPGLILGVHFITWITGARLTLAANSTLIVNMVPVVMPFLLFFIVKEKVTGWELLGTALALGGVAVLTGRDFHPGAGTVAGDIVCVVSMLFYAVYMALGKRNNRTPGVWLYVVPLYYVGAVFCFIVSLFFTSPFTQPASAGEIFNIVALAVFPTIIGHTVINRSMLVLRGQVVSLFALSQFVYAAVLAFFIFGEVPAPTFYIATALVLAGTLIAIFQTAKVESEPDGNEKA